MWAQVNSAEENPVVVSGFNPSTVNAFQKETGEASKCLLKKNILVQLVDSRYIAAAALPLHEMQAPKTAPTA